jgi:hypothetical protein
MIDVSEDLSATETSQLIWMREQLELQHERLQSQANTAAICTIAGVTMFDVVIDVVGRSAMALARLMRMTNSKWVHPIKEAVILANQWTHECLEKLLKVENELRNRNRIR